MSSYSYLPVTQDEIVQNNNVISSSSSSSHSSKYNFFFKRSNISIVNTILIIIFAVLIFIEIHDIKTQQSDYQNDIKSLRSRMTNAEESIQALSRNNTNFYVLNELQKVQNNVDNMRIEIESQLELTEMNVNRSLSNTLEELSVTVAAAKKSINDQVDEVRSDMDVYITVTNKQLAAESHFMKYQVAGFFTLLACLISLWHIVGHLQHIAKPAVQRRILAILLMVVVYSVTSWLSLVFPSASEALGAIRDCYEAYVIYTFMSLLIEIISDGKGIQTARQILTQTQLNLICQRNDPEVAQKPDLLKPPCPCHYNRNNPMSVAAAVLDQCQVLAMQFVLLKPILAITPLFIESLGYDYVDHKILRDDNSIDLTSPKFYVIVLENVSVVVAFYGLASFYYATENELAWCNPWPKFLCIKGIVFATFWQGFAISMFSRAGVVDNQGASDMQNILICVEMLLASIMHHLFFPYEEWEAGYKKSKEKTITHLRDTLAMRDFISDMKHMIKRSAWEGVWEDMDEKEPEEVNIEVELLAQEFKSQSPSSGPAGQLYTSSDVESS